jgi:hypothetical protein
MNVDVESWLKIVNKEVDKSMNELIKLEKIKFKEISLI